MKVFEKVSNGIVKISGACAFILIFAEMFLIAVSVLMRVLFKSPISGLTDYVEVLTGSIIAFALCVTESKSKHIEVAFIREFAPKPVSRTLYVFTNIFAVVFVGVAVWRFFLRFLSDFSTGNKSMTVGFPYWPIDLILAIGCLFFLIVMIYNRIATVQSWQRKEVSEE